MVGSPPSLSTRTAQELKRTISNNMRHIPGSTTRLVWQNTLRRLAPAHSNTPPSRETPNVISVSITSTVRLCSLRNRRKFGYVGGLKTIYDEKGCQVVGVLVRTGRGSDSISGHGTLTKPLIVKEISRVSMQTGWLKLWKYRRTCPHRRALFLAERHVPCWHGLQGDRRPRRGVPRVQSTHLGARRRGAVQRCSSVVTRMKENVPRLLRDQSRQSQRLKRACCQTVSV